MRFRLVLWGIVCVSVILYVCYLLNMYVCDCVCGGSGILVSAALLLDCLLGFCYIYGFSVMISFLLIWLCYLNVVMNVW